MRAIGTAKNANLRNRVTVPFEEGFPRAMGGFWKGNSTMELRYLTGCLFGTNAK
jgi:hypothetical protein